MSDWSNPSGAQTGQQPPPPGWGGPPAGGPQAGQQPPPGWGSQPPPGAVPPPQGWGGPPGAPPTQRPTNGLAIAALIVGIIALLVSWIPFAGFLGIVAVVLGILGISRAKRPGGSGKGMAIGGLATGGLGTLAGIGWIVATTLFIGALSQGADDFVTGLEEAASEFEQVTEEDQTGQTEDSTTTVQGESVSVFDLAVSDCFNAPEDTDSPIGEVEVVACEQPHENEVFALLDYPAGSADAYPGEDEVSSWADENCRPPFDAYVGIDYASSQYYITTLYPTQQSWDQGDREVVCILYVLEPPTTGSAQGSGQ